MTPLVPQTLTIEIDYDKYGHCVSCHRYLMLEKLIDGKIVEVNHPDYGEEEFLLNDGSRMRVAICVKCKDKITKSDETDIMKSVIRGWATEIQYIKHWTDDMRKKYMKVYSKKRILMKSTGVRPEITDEAFRKHKEKK